MGIALTTDQRDLAAAVRDFTARHAPVTKTREELAGIAEGKLPAAWDALKAQGFLAIHLPEDAGGDGGGITELAVLLEEAARGLLPGPLLPTVAASLAVSRYGQPGEHGSTAELLRAFAGGAAAGCATTAAGLTATPEPAGGWRVSGTTVPVPGALSGQFLLLGAETGPETAGGIGGDVWFVIPHEPSATLKATKVDGTDLTRDLGTVTLDGHPVAARQALTATTGELRDLLAVLFAAEAAGTARWCQEAGLAYVKVREQFGVPVGSFQAVKHKCARLFGQVEVLTAAAWDAASAASQATAAQAASSQSGAQASYAAAAAAAICLPGAVDIALDTVTLHGGIGYTWEHDTHLYWRRALSLASLLGPEAVWEELLGALAATVTRTRLLELDDEPDGLREQVAQSIAAALRAPESSRQKVLADAGLVSPHYPRPYGLAAGPAEQVIISQEFERAGLRQPSTIVGEWALPTILAHGTDAQRDRFAAPTLRGELDWCQLFSEPGAGSDLASLKTKATRTDGGWLLSGQKVWTSNARQADWAICLARTDPDVPRHKGISYFLVDMKSRGVDVRPLREANGGYLFNEVFLDDVFVPDGLLVGAPGDGWKLARTTLGNERVSIGSGMSAPVSPAAIAAELGAAGPAVTRDVGRLTAWQNATEAMTRRGLLQRLDGIQPGAEGSVLKLMSAAVGADIRRAALAWAGPAGAVLEGDPEDTGAGGRGTALAYLSLPATLIGGGTSEIQLNVIAERVLGLPRG
jgi:alkylation response protein AidB-like acyl-CoA dehydrogenase